MKFDIKPYSSIGPIKFDMSENEVRKILRTNYKSFKRTPDTEYPCDYFNSLGVFVYYKKNGLVEAVELTTPAEAIFENTDLLSLSFDRLKNFLQSKDPNLEIESDSLTSILIGVGAYAPDAAEDQQQPVESIIVFEKGYYKGL